MNTFCNKSGHCLGMLAASLFLAGCGIGGGDTHSNDQLFPVSITGSISLDTTNSLSGSGGAAQSGTLTLVSHAKAQTATFNGDPALIAPNPSLTGAVVKIGDGIGAHFSMSGSSNGAPAVSDGVFSDFSFDLHNPSSSDTYRVTFQATLTNTVSAGGADAYAYGDISLRDAGNVELYFSEHRIDTRTENAGNDLNADATSDVFWIDLAPGATYRVSALQRQRGGALASGGYSADIDTFVKVKSVEKVI
jgi:hypothetical protein